MISAYLRMSAVLLLSAFLVACSTQHEMALGAVGPNAVRIKVDGMACPNCARHIAAALAEVPGVRGASVDFASKTAYVDLDPNHPATIEALHAAVEHWRTEHFAQEEDPECLDPERRKELQQQMGEQQAR